MRSSGHESFCCRYPWLPKAYAALNENPSLFADEASAMVELGLGKNMVRSLRFWVQCFGIAEVSGGSGRELVPTSLGHELLDTNEGWDPYLEDIQTLWLLHWKLANCPNPLLAWDELMFRWPHAEITRSAIMAELTERAHTYNLRASKRTLNQHFDVFIATYVPAKAQINEVIEDSLDCPLTELRLIHRAGQRLRASGPSEPVYAFRHEPKPEIGPALFMYCLHEFWEQHHSQEQTLSLRQIASDPGSPGRVFRLPEIDIRNRLENIAVESGDYFSYVESVNIQQVQRLADPAPDFLPFAYEENSARG